MSQVESNVPWQSGRYLSRYNAHHIPTTRPEKVWPLDVAAIEAWTARQEIARDAYWLTVHCSACGVPTPVARPARMCGACASAKARRAA